MSLFFQSDAQLQKSLDRLPETYTNAQIREMVQNLLKDMESTSYMSFENIAAKTMHYSENNQKFCLAFPMLFRGIVRGSFTPSMLDTFLATRHSLQKGELDADEAKNALVDAGVEYIKNRSK